MSGYNVMSKLLAEESSPLKQNKYPLLLLMKKIAKESSPLKPLLYPHILMCIIIFENPPCGLRDYVRDMLDIRHYLQYMYALLTVPVITNYYEVSLRSIT